MKLTEEFFILSDLHFGHSKIIEYARKEFKTIEEHDDHIVNQWNSVVSRSDKALILGDVSFKKDTLLRLNEMHGLKYLVAGNHDLFSVTRFQNYFHDVKGAINWTDPTHNLRIVFTHIPIHPGQLERWNLNIHGHTHFHRVHTNKKIDHRYLNVCCEALDFTPQKLKTLLDWWIPNLKG